MELTQLLHSTSGHVDGIEFPKLQSTAPFARYLRLWATEDRYDLSVNAATGVTSSL